MKTWILTVTVSCLILSVLGLLLPEGKTKKYVFGTLRMALLLVIASPVLSLFSGENNDFFSIDTDLYSQQAVFDEQNNSLFLCILCENELKKNGVDCTVSLTKEGENIYADILVEEAVISEEEGNIYKNSKTVIDIATKYLPVDKEQIRVWVK